MANGGLIATAGCHLLALAAQHASVPLVVCAGLYKLTPLFPSGPESFTVLLSPQPMLRYVEGLQGVYGAREAQRGLLMDVRCGSDGHRCQGAGGVHHGRALPCSTTVARGGGEDW